MSDTLFIRPVDLLIDEENPRLPQPNVGQREAMRGVARNQQRKLVVLAKDIVQWGMNPADLPIVMPLGGDVKRHVVLEGNRRLVALKALENPEPFLGAVDDSVIKDLRALSKDYQESPVESIQCLVVKNREAARHWIELRHTGQNEGAGTVRWESDESARFRARGGHIEVHTQALNLLERRGLLTPETRSKVQPTSYKRLLETPELRAKCGFEVDDGEMRLLADEKTVAKALLHIANDLISKKIVTKDIYTKEDRVKYANGLPTDVVVKPTRKPGEGTPPGEAKAQAKPKRPQKPKAPRVRDILIPGDCTLNVSDARIRDIERELRSLSLERHPNAVSVLSRVFLELSIDAYIVAKSLTVLPAAKLRHKLQEVVNDLVSKRKLTAEQARPLRTALQKDSFLAPSLDQMNDYVHSSQVFPAPSDLRANWDTLQPFFVALWSA